MGKVDIDPTNESHMQHTCKSGFYKCNNQRLPSATNVPKEDAVLVVWGDKITGNISHKIQFHASKEVARQYLQTQQVKPWTSERFDKVSWEHLNSALQTKSDMYKIWCSKQISGICGTRVQVGRYTGQDFPDEHCPNCACQETAVHLM
jgi:hypothetical protein